MAYRHRAACVSAAKKLRLIYFLQRASVFQSEWVRASVKGDTVRFFARENQIRKGAAELIEV